MKNDKFLYCYKMTHDTGFAPNPYHGVLTLATCKPTIRRCAKEGYWISGWTSNVVQGKDEKYHFSDETQSLIYLAEVSAKIEIEKYWDLYEDKRPKKIYTGNQKTTHSCGDKSNAMSFSYDMGDNIYEPINGEFEQLPNGGGHDKNNIQHDLSGKFVLICEKFYYFGVEHAIPKTEIINGEKFVVPRCKKMLLNDHIANQIKKYITENYSQGINPQKNENHLK